MTSPHSGQTGSVGGEGQPPSNAQMVAELQALAIGIRMFGLSGLANMSTNPLSPDASPGGLDD